jgi:hypothetical protein
MRLAIPDPAADGGSRMIRCLLLPLAMAVPLPAADLHGIPVPGRIDTPVLALEAGDSDLGYEGGASGDDWRVAYADLDWDHGWISASADLSILTSKASSGAAATSPPSFTPAQGSGRSDEFTAAIAYRSTFDLSAARSWLQFGPGIQIAGDLGGRTIQNDFHSVIGNPPSDLPYDHPGLLFAGLVHAGLGGRVDLAGPCAVDARGVGLLTTSGWSRWRAECLLLAVFPYGGLWSGVRQDGAAGHALTAIADDVARHESGFSVVVGLTFHYRSFEFSLESSHTFTNGGQDGRFAIAYAPP